MLFTDQLYRNIEIKSPPRKIISLVPSQTEFLYDIGLEDELAGITKFCIHPDHLFRTKTRVGGTKKINRDIIAKIGPDLVIGNKEENTKEDIEWLASQYPVWVSDICTLEDAFHMMIQLGMITGRTAQASHIVTGIRKEFMSLSPDKTMKTAAYLIWKEPLMTVNQGTFIHHMMEMGGYSNVFGDETLRYPEISMTRLQELSPAIVFLSSEPYPFDSRHLEEFSLRLPRSKVMLADGEMFSWYGSRLLQSAAYFRQLAKQ